MKNEKRLHLQSILIAMSTLNLYRSIKIAQEASKKLFAVLIDPDKVSLSEVESLIGQSITAKVDVFLVGGSLVTDDSLEQLVKFIKKNCSIPVILFPGSPLQLTRYADALLFLSLISGRNADFLIGQHVTAAPMIKSLDLEVIPTGYMLIDGGKATTASYISNTNPIPHNKPAIACCTALAGSYLGLKMIYMDTGSGAESHVSLNMVKAVRETIDLPLIIGGGIREPETAYNICKAGADMIVVGTAIEKDSSIIFELSEAIHSAKG